VKLKICICLSHELSAEGVLSFDSHLRISKASEVFKEKECDLLITTGWKNHKLLDQSVSEFMANEAINKFNIPEEKIIKESKPKDTVGEAVYTKLRIYKDFAFERLIIYIVTSDWHVSRAEEIFNFVYADNNTKLDFIEIMGSKEESINEIDKDSISEFRSLISDCTPGDINKIYQSMKKDHKLYSQKH